MNTAELSVPLGRLQGAEQVSLGPILTLGWRPRVQIRSGRICQDPAKLRRVIVDLINEEDWSSMGADVKGDAYECLLENSAQDQTSGAAHYSHRARGHGSSQTCFICSKISYMSSLAHRLLGQTRSAVLSALLLRPESSLHVRELARLTGASPGSLHRELRALAEMGLLLRQEIGRQVHYRANLQSPVFHELAALLRKTAGLADVLRDALAPLGHKVELAFVYGSVAAGTEQAGSDVDLMVLGTATFGDLARVLAAAQEALRREVNPTVMPRAEFTERLSHRDGFALSVVRGAKLWLKGADSELAESAEDRAP